jgi:8-oxo-dGTP pyrophosphatase MutT (NUDIX family)
MSYAADPSKEPSAVVLAVRDGLVLALTRRDRVHDLHLPGGKWEARDGEAGNVLDGGSIHTGCNLRRTAVRELAEEAGVYLNAIDVEPLCSFVAHTGRPVMAYRARLTHHWPTTFTANVAGWPGWVPPAALLQPWCTFREECAQILAAAGVQS